MDIFNDLDIDLNSWCNFSEIEIIKDRYGKEVKTLSVPDFSTAKLKVWRKGDFIHTIKEGDRLDRLAVEYYGNKMLWWVIAYRNNMQFPVVQMSQGTKIVINDPEYIKTLIQR